MQLVTSSWVVSTNFEVDWDLEWTWEFRTPRTLIVSLNHSPSLSTQVVECILYTDIHSSWLDEKSKNFISIHFNWNTAWVTGESKWREKQIAFSTSTALLTADFIRRIHFAIENLLAHVPLIHTKCPLTSKEELIPQVVGPLSWYWVACNKHSWTTLNEVVWSCQNLQMVPGYLRSCFKLRRRDNQRPN
jgi:hypothetical protein